MNTFYLSDIHVRLARRASLTLWDRNNEDRCLMNLSYGNDNLLGDIAEEARVPDPDWETVDDWEPNTKAFLIYLRQDMAKALQYILHYGTFEPGVFVTQYGHYELVTKAYPNFLDEMYCERIDADTLRVGVMGRQFFATSRIKGGRIRPPFSTADDIGLGTVYDITGVGDTATSKQGALLHVAIQQFLMKEAWGYSVHEQSKLY
jgi:hypothetical protein